VNASSGVVLDNDHVQDDLRDHLEREFGAEARDRYWAIFEQLRSERGLPLRNSIVSGRARRPPASWDQGVDGHSVRWRCRISTAQDPALGVVGGGRGAVLDAVAARYPARHYVVVDDKLRILAAIKQVWDDRVTTIFPRQGHYALDPKIMGAYPAADLTVEHIGELVDYDLPV
jgi:hypothetical protein